MLGRSKARIDDSTPGISNLFIILFLFGYTVCAVLTYSDHQLQITDIFKVGFCLIMKNKWSNNFDESRIAGAPSPNCPSPLRDLGPYIIHGSLGSPYSTTQTASRLVKPFVLRTDRQTDRQTTLHL